MKLLVLISITVLSLVFSGCAGATFNPNNKEVKFLNGDPYFVPISSIGKKNKTISIEEHIILKNVFGINNCKEGDYFWIHTDNLKESLKKGTRSSFVGVKNILNKDGGDNFKAYQIVKELQKPNSMFKSSTHQNNYIAKSILNISTENTTLYQLKKNRNFMDFLEKGSSASFVSYMIREGHGGCVNKMSKQEYEYYLNNQNRNNQNSGNSNSIINRTNYATEEINKMNNRTTYDYNSNSGNTSNRTNPSNNLTPVIKSGNMYHYDGNTAIKSENMLFY